MDQLRHDIEILFMSRKEVGGGLASTEYSVDASTQRHEDYIEYAEDDWLLWPETIQIPRGSTEQK